VRKPSESIKTAAKCMQQNKINFNCQAAVRPVSGKCNGITSRWTCKKPVLAFQQAWF